MSITPIGIYHPIGLHGSIQCLGDFFFTMTTTYHILTDMPALLAVTDIDHWRTHEWGFDNTA